MPVDHQKNMRPTMAAVVPGGPHFQSIVPTPSPSSTTASLFSSSQPMMPSPSPSPSSTAAAASFSPAIPPPVPQRTLPRMESPTLGRRPQSDIVLPSFNELIQNVQLPSFDPSSQSSVSRPVSAPPEANPSAYNSLQRALRVQQQTSNPLPSSQHFFSPQQQQQQQQQQQTPASPLHHFPQQLSQQLPLPSPSHGSPFIFHQQQQQQQSLLFGQQDQAARQRFGTTGGFLPNPSSSAQAFGDQFTRELKQAQQYQQQQFKHEQQYQQASSPSLAPSQHQQQQQQPQTQFTYSAPQQRKQGQYDNAVVIPRGGSQASAESSTRQQQQQQQPDMGFNSGQYGDSRHPHASQLSSNLQAVSRLPFDSHQQQASQFWQGGANAGAVGRNGSPNGNDQYSFVPMFVEPKATSRSHPPVVLNPHSKKTRSNFPKEIISILKKWLATHWDNPYPSSEDKRILMAQTGLDKKQIINWFINARRRLVLPKKGQISSPSSGPPAILFSDDESDEDGLSDDDLDNGQHNHDDDDDDSNTEDNDQVMSISGSQQQQQQMGSAMSPRPFHRKAPVRRPTGPSQPATSAAVSSLISMRQQAFNPSF